MPFTHRVFPGGVGGAVMRERDRDLRHGLIMRRAEIQEIGVAALEGILRRFARLRREQIAPENGLRIFKIMLEQFDTCSSTLRDRPFSSGAQLLQNSVAGINDAACGIDHHRFRGFAQTLDHIQHHRAFAGDVGPACLGIARFIGLAHPSRDIANALVAELFSSGSSSCSIRSSQVSRSKPDSASRRRRAQWLLPNWTFRSGRYALDNPSRFALPLLRFLPL